MNDQTSTRRAAALSESVEIAKFRRNQKREAIVVQLRGLQRRPIVDARVNFTDGEGRLRPTKKGLSLALRFPQLAKALPKAGQTAPPGLAWQGWRP